MYLILMASYVVIYCFERIYEITVLCAQFFDYKI